MKTIVTLGSTGNLGKQTLKVLQNFPQLQLIGLSAHKNAELLERQALELGKDGDMKITTVLSSEKPAQLTELATKADIVINLIAGIAGIEPTKAALKAGKTLLLANKESLVAAGTEITELIQFPGQIIPVDSEHNAIYEILRAYPKETPAELILPCSGGPLLNHQTPSSASLEEILKHPKWNMGAKISIESAFLINKGLEILEAHYLFSFPLEKITAVIHPECQIHGMVRFKPSPTLPATPEFPDGQTIGYLSEPNMKGHISNALHRALSPSKTPPNLNIRPLNPEEIPTQEPPHHKLPGIKALLAAHQKGQIKEFLQKEEKLIEKIITQQESPSALLSHLHTLACT